MTIDEQLKAQARKFAGRVVSGSAKLAAKDEWHRQQARLTLEFAFTILAQHNLEPRPRWRRYRRRKA